MKRPLRKRALNDANLVTSQGRTLPEEFLEKDAIIGSPNQVEAVYANLEKRAPKFVDPEG